MDSLSSLPCDLILQIGNDLLNPKERARLSMCNKRFHSLLPSWLRIKIMTSDAAVETNTTCTEVTYGGGADSSAISGAAAIATEFFVSLVDSSSLCTTAIGTGNPNPPQSIQQQQQQQEKQERQLFATEQLWYDVAYYFWSFDYQRGNRTYLGRHTRHAHNGASFIGQQRQYIYTIGLRPRHPNQTWKIASNTASQSNTTTTTTTNIETKKPIPWGQCITLMVCGNNPKPRQPDSSGYGNLCCFPNNTTSSLLSSLERGAKWVIADAEYDQMIQRNKLVILPSDQYHRLQHPLQETQLTVYAPPDVCDDGEYLLHSPKSIQYGSVCSEGFHVVVSFHFWITDSIMYFGATSAPFALGIPILQSDDIGPDGCPIRNLLQIKSARWGCVIYYMAVAADVAEGRPLDMDQFLSRVTDHRDHDVQMNDARDLVYINVRRNKVKTNALINMPKDESMLWKFIISW